MRNILFQNEFYKFSTGSSSIRIKDKTGKYVSVQGPTVHTVQIRREFNEHILEKIRTYAFTQLQWSSVLWEVKQESINTRAALYELLNDTSDVTEYTCEIAKSGMTFDLLVSFAKHNSTHYYFLDQTHESRACAEIYNQ